MVIFNYLKNIYLGKKNLTNQLSLFSILGIMTICLNNTLSSKLGNIFAQYFGFAPTGRLELFLDTFFGVLLFIYSVGYICQYVHSVYNGENNLPEISFKPFIIFVKILPLFITWGIYLLILFFLGMSLFRFGTILSYIYYAVLFFLPVFINVIYALFLRNFEYKAEYFNPLFIFLVIDKSLGSVIILSLELLIICIIPAFFIYHMFLHSFQVEFENIRLSLRLGVLCLSMYFVNVIHYLYSAGLANIIKEHYNE